MNNQTCRQCGEAKPFDAFERLSTGGYRGTCLVCRRAAAAERKRMARQSPQHLEETARAAEERGSIREAEAARRYFSEARHLAEEKAAAVRAEVDARRLRQQALWAPMWTERARRAPTAVLPEPEGICTLPLKNGGYISVVEFGARVEERRLMRKRLRLDPVEAVMVEEETEGEPGETEAV